MLRDVVVLAFDGVSPFELGVACEVFGVDRSCLVQPWPDFAVCGLEPGSIRTGGNFNIQTSAGLDRLEQADLAIVTWWAPFTLPPPAPAMAALRRVVDMGG